ncbi:MAG: carboxypeptidase-like regulatory domain-containing protein, partial [Bacteroidota bacterium]
MQLKTSTLILIFSLVLGGLHAQTGIVTGTINDLDGSPMEFANVSLAGTTLGQTTDKNGNYRIAGVAAGEYNLLVTSVGYEDETRPITLAAGQTLTVDVQFTTDAIDLQSVEITGRRAISYQNKETYSATKTGMLIKDAPTAIDFVTKELILDQAAFSLNDVLKNVAGVNQFSFYNDITIRGFRVQGQ